MTRPIILILTLAASLLPLRSTSTAVLPDLDSPVSAEEIALLDSISRWLEGKPGSIVAHIESERAAFDAFRRWNPREVRRHAVIGLPWGEEIFETAQRHQLDSLLLAAVVEVESGFRPQATSPRGAIGLMQVLPTTAGVEDAGELLIPERNLESGASYLRALLDRFDGDLVLALAAYNAGPGAVARFRGVPPYRETQAYVEKVLSRYVEHHRGLWQSGKAPETLVFG